MNEKTSVINVRMPEDMKKKAQKALAEVGLSTSDAVRIFFRQVVAEGALPFQPKLGADML